MKVDFTKKIVDIEGSPLFDETIENGKVKRLNKFLDLRTIAVRALLSHEEKITGEDKMKRFLLAMKIQNIDVLDLKTDEIVLVKKMVNENFSVLVAAQSCLLLENEEKKIIFSKK